MTHLENPHLDLALIESRAACETTPWLRWVDELEDLIGHDLDGSQHIDGYSLDYALDLFMDGVTPEEASRALQ